MLLSLGRNTLLLQIKLKIGTKTIAWASIVPGVVNTDIVSNCNQILEQKFYTVTGSESVAGY
jgi:hypothetical protein